MDKQCLIDPCATGKFSASKVRFYSSPMAGGGEVKEDGKAAYLDKDVMMVYTGKFSSMDGDVTIKDEDVEKLAANHNDRFKHLNLASGPQDIGQMPPLQLDHSTSARDTVGRLVGPLTVGEHVVEGKKVKALFGKARFLGAENIEKAKDGRFSHVSIGADLDTHQLSELSVTPFPAAADAALLKRMAKLTMKPHSETTHNGQVICIAKTEAGQYIWDAVGHAGICATEVEALADAKDAIEEFQKMHPEEEDRNLAMKRFSKVEMPGHVDEAVWSKAKDAYKDASNKSKIDDKWAFITAWYKKNGGTFSKGKRPEVRMGRKEAAEMYAKCKKHLTEVEKMSEEDADKKLEASSDEEMSKMAADHDEHLKHLEDEQKKEKDAELKRMAKFKDHKDKVVKLAAGIKKTNGDVKLAQAKMTIGMRLAKLRAEAKVSPAEIKSLDVEKLATMSQESIDAVLKTYEGRQPVIHTGIFGSTKALSGAKANQVLKKLQMEREELLTRLNMPMKAAEAKAKLAEVEKEMARVESVPAHVDVLPDEGEKMRRFEEMHAHFKKLMDEGKHDEAKEHLRKHYMGAMPVGPDTEHMSDSGMPVGPDTAHMSALADSVAKMQTEFKEVLGLVAPVFGITEAELQ